MEKFNGYIYSLILTALVTVIVELITPSASATSRQVNFVCGLCIAVALIMPVKEGVEWLIAAQHEGFFDIGGDHVLIEDYDDAFSEQINKLSEDELKRVLCERFDISSENVDVRLILDEDYNIGQITVILSGKGIFANPHELINYLENTYGCEAEVAIS